MSAPGYAPSLASVPGSQIREIAELAMTMPDILKLYFGESSLPTPAYIIDAANRALAAGETFYSENAGLPALREAIAEQYSRLHGVALDWGSEIVVSASGVQALNLAVRAAIEPGDEAIILSPAWPNSSAITRLYHGMPIDLPLRLVGARYEIDFAALEDALTDRTRLLVLTSPSNPLGWVATVEEQQKLLDLCRARDIWLLADEVYERLYYGGAELGEPAPSILRLCSRDDRVIVVQSFSKTYCMTGWRLGWLVAPPAVGRKLAQLNEYVVSHAATFSQHAALVALQEGEPELHRMLGALRANRDFAVAALEGLPGVTVPEPGGAFYLFPHLDGLEDSMAFCRDLLLEHHVGLAPGSAFGSGGEGSIRICYAAERSVLEPALERLELFVRSRS